MVLNSQWPVLCYAIKEMVKWLGRTGANKYAVLRVAGR